MAHLGVVRRPSSGLDDPPAAQARGEPGTLGGLDPEAPFPEGLRPLGGRRPERGAARRGAAGAQLALVALLVWGVPWPAPALVGDLTPDGIREAIDAGTAAITQDDFAEEWQLRLPGGEDIVVSTPFSRLALTARQIAMKGDILTEKQQKDQIDRGKGRIQLLVTMHGGPSRTFARFYTPVLQVNGKEIKASFVQNERTPIVGEDGRLAARNVYV